ncbi:MAG: HD domain-containing protein [Armatimonadetes bacterium]|nr:HD domain-containing protein [Armatimonadota bacterium]
MENRVNLNPLSGQGQRTGPPPGVVNGGSTPPPLPKDDVRLGESSAAPPAAPQKQMVRPSNRVVAEYTRFQEGLVLRASVPGGPGHLLPVPLFINAFTDSQGKTTIRAARADQPEQPLQAGRSGDGRIYIELEQGAPLAVFNDKDLSFGLSSPVQAGQGGAYFRPMEQTIEPDGNQRILLNQNVGPVDGRRNQAQTFTEILQDAAGLRAAEVKYSGPAGQSAPKTTGLSAYGSGRTEYQREARELADGAVEVKNAGVMKQLGNFWKAGWGFNLASAMSGPAPHVFVPFSRMDPAQLFPGLVAARQAAPPPPPPVERASATEPPPLVQPAPPPVPVQSAPQPVATGDATGGKPAPAEKPVQAQVLEQAEQKLPTPAELQDLSRELQAQQESIFASLASDADRQRVVQLQAELKPGLKEQAQKIGLSFSEQQLDAVAHSQALAGWANTRYDELGRDKADPAVTTKLLQIYKADEAIRQVESDLAALAANPNLAVAPEAAAAQANPGIAALQKLPTLENGYTQAHAQRAIDLLALPVAMKLGLNAEQLQSLEDARGLYDIGKTLWPERMFDPQLKYGDAEKALMKDHVRQEKIGAVLDGLNLPGGVRDVILNHHERPDGKGYPRGLKAGQISKVALIASAADALEAMTNPRTNRAGDRDVQGQVMDLDKAVQRMREGAGTQFDAKVVDAMLSRDVLEPLLGKAVEDGRYSKQAVDSFLDRLGPGQTAAADSPAAAGTPAAAASVGAAALEKLQNLENGYTRTHSFRALDLYGLPVARKLGLNEEQTQALADARGLHDIGKTLWPEKMFDPKLRYGDEERALMKDHVREEKVGPILDSLGIYPAVQDIVLNHHERPDGKGYPRGLKAGEISTPALIAAAVDAFDAMTSPRTNRAGDRDVQGQVMSLEKATGILKRGAGTEFDAAVVDALLSKDVLGPALQKAVQEGRYEQAAVDDFLARFDQIKAAPPPPPLGKAALEKLAGLEGGYTQAHAQRSVVFYALPIAKKLGMSDEQMEALYDSRNIYDVGKILWPDKMFDPTLRYGDEEKAIMKDHVREERVGPVLDSLKVYPLVRETVLNHHERPDGRGYPRGLQAGQIPQTALVLAAADAFDAMTSPRTNRAGDRDVQGQVMGLEKAAGILRKGAGTEFDAAVVEALLSRDVLSGALAKAVQDGRYDQAAVDEFLARLDAPKTPA